MDPVTGGRHVSYPVCIFEVEVHLQTHTYLIGEKFQQEWAQKNYAQAFWIELTLHQTDTEKIQIQKQRYKVNQKWAKKNRNRREKEETGRSWINKKNKQKTNKIKEHKLKACVFNN